jgi:hypothetical protein
MRVGPDSCRLDGTLGATNSSAPFRNCTEAFDTASPSQSYHRITHVGVGTDADKASEKLDVATVIRNIKSVSGDSSTTSWDPTVAGSDSCALRTSRGARSNEFHGNRRAFLSFS